MYTDKDYDEIKKAYNRFVVVYLLITVVFLAVTVVSCMVRISWLGYVAAAIWGFLTVFLWSFKGNRMRRYLIYLKEMKTGRQHVVYGEINNIEDEVFLRDGVEFYAVDILMENSKSKDSEMVSRRVYYDFAKGKPPFTIGNHVEFVMYGNYIKEIT